MGIQKKREKMRRGEGEVGRKIAEGWGREGGREEGGAGKGGGTTESPEVPTPSLGPGFRPRAGVDGPGPRKWPPTPEIEEKPAKIETQRNTDEKSKRRKRRRGKK